MKCSVLLACLVVSALMWCIAISAMQVVMANA